MTYEEAVAIANASNESENQPFVIDKNLRTIAVPDGFLLGVTFDKDVQIIPFVCPRFYNGIDLSTFNVTIYYKYNMGDTPYPYRDTYVPESVDIGDDTITFNWIVSDDVTQFTGDIEVAVELEMIDSETYSTSKRFGTQPVKLPVVEGLYLPLS